MKEFVVTLILIVSALGSKVFHKKTYRDITAVNNQSLDIKKGEIFGFLGPNGAGKTTTINLDYLTILKTVLPLYK